MERVINSSQNGGVLFGNVGSEAVDKKKANIHLIVVSLSNNCFFS